MSLQEKGCAQVIGQSTAATEGATASASHVCQQLVTQDIVKFPGIVSTMQLPMKLQRRCKQSNDLVANPIVRVLLGRIAQPKATPVERQAKPSHDDITSSTTHARASSAQGKGWGVLTRHQVPLASGQYKKV